MYWNSDIREAGGDRDAVTGGTRILSDWIIVRITCNEGESFLDQMISMVEGAKRQKTPNEIALSILLAAMTIIFLLVCVSLIPFSIFSVDSFNGKRRQIAFGKCPFVSLAEAREMKFQARKLLAQGFDPVENRRQTKLDNQISSENNFEAIAKHWHENKKHTWEPKHTENILKRLETYMFPIIGRKAIC